MKQKFLLKSLLLLFALIVGSLNSWGADNPDYTFTLASGDFTSSTHSKTSGSLIWTVSYGTGITESYGWDNTYGFKFGSGNSSYPTAFKLTSSSVSNKIKKIVVTANVNSSKSCKLDVKVGSTTYGSQATISTKKHDTWEFSIADESAVNGAVELSFSSNTGPLYLEKIDIYYYVATNVTSLSIGTAPTKVNYKVGEKLDLAGLVLNADGNNVTSGYTAKIGETTVTSGTTVLNTVGAQTITFTYGGKTCTQVIHVGALQSISLTTTNVKTTYFHNEEAFNPANLVVTANFSDEESTPTTWDVDLTASDYSYSPTTTLLSSNDKVTVSYTWNNVNKTADIPLTVYAVSSLAVTTAPTTTAYRVGDNLDLTDVVVKATFDDPNTTQKEISASNYTANPANGAALAANNTTVTFTYAGQTANQAITVGTLDHLTYNATGNGAFANTTYTEKDKFNADGLVVNAHFTNGIVNENVSGYTLSPDTDTELTTTNDKVTVSYTWAGTTQTVDIPITVNAGTKYTVTFDAQTGTCGTASLTEQEYKGGVTLPTATCSKTGWDFAGWATSAVSNTTTAPTLYTAGAKYYPTAATTLYAVYSVAEFDGTRYKRATTVEEITSAPAIAVVNNGKILKKNFSVGNDANAPSEENQSSIAISDDVVWKLTGNNTDGYTLTNGNVTVGANGTTNAQLQNTTTNSLWIVEKSNNSANTFVLRMKASTNNGCMEYYSSQWKVYTSGSSFNYLNNSNVACKIYYAPRVAYNSNPTDIINPTIEFEKGGTTLYLDGTTTYTNTASVEGVSKAITYSSSDETVAEVDENGVVTAKKIGTATITASVAQELGVSNAAQATYEIVVKSTTTIAGIKAVNSTTTATAFTADLTDANITYVSGTHAYIQDASAAIYVSCATNDWVAGKKFTGAVSGKVKKSYGVWEITELTGTPVEGGTVPAALTDVAITDITAQTYESYEGKKITLTGVTVTTAMTSSATSGGEVSDGTNTIKIGAPATGITLVKDEQGSVTGFVAQYNGTYRLNLYEQSQFAKTHNAPTAQTLTFTSDAVELDEDTEAFTNFSPQAVSGAQGTVTYAIEGDVIYDNFSTADGTFTLKTGVYGTATITATAAAANITEGGVTTPYTQTTKSYTVTTYPRYTSTFIINGAESVVRQATHGATIAVPTPATMGDYSFVGWKETSGIDTPTDVAPTMVTPPTTPTSNVTYYAVYAQQRAGGTEEVTSTLNLKQSEPANQTTTNNGVVWSWSSDGVTFSSSSSAGFKGTSGSITFELPTNALNAKSVALNCPSDAWGSGATVALTSGNSKLTDLGKGGSYTFTNSDNNKGTYSLAQTTASKNAWINSIVVKYNVQGVENYGYCTSLPLEAVSVPAKGYITFCSTKALDFTGIDAIKVYKAKVNSNKVTLTQIYKVPANEGVILMNANGLGSAVEETIVPCLTGDADDVSDNELEGVTEDTNISYTTPGTGYNYVFQQKATDSAPKFYKAPAATLRAKRAYLHTSYDVTPLGAPALSIDIDEGGTTSMSLTPTLSEGEGVWYDLSGRKLQSKPTAKGIYIMNGKKVIIK